MSFRKTSDGGPPAGPAVEMTCGDTTRLGQRQRSPRELVAGGVFYPPAGRRNLGVVVVATCPSCADMHLHPAEARDDIDGAARLGSCGVPYVVQLEPLSVLGGAA